MEKYVVSIGVSRNGHTNYLQELNVNCDSIERICRTLRYLSEKCEDAEKTMDSAEKNGQRTDIEELELSVRSYKTLKKAGYVYVEDLAAVENPEVLMKIRGMGQYSFAEIVRRMREYYPNWMEGKV